MTKKQRQDKIKKLRRIRQELKELLAYDYWSHIDELCDSIETHINVDFERESRHD